VHRHGFVGVLELGVPALVDTSEDFPAAELSLDRVLGDLIIGQLCPPRITAKGTAGILGLRQVNHVLAEQCEFVKQVTCSFLRQFPANRSKLIAFTPAEESGAVH
jgi:hypothetical protein